MICSFRTTFAELINLRSGIVNHVHKVIEIFRAKRILGHEATFAIALASRERTPINGGGNAFDLARVRENRKDAPAVSDGDDGLVALVLNCGR